MEYHHKLPDCSSKSILLTRYLKNILNHLEMNALKISCLLGCIGLAVASGYDSGFGGHEGGGGGGLFDQIGGSAYGEPYQGGSGWDGGDDSGYSSDSYHTQGQTFPVGKHIEVTRPIAVPVHKQIFVPIQKPVNVNIPHPVLVPVPQPYPIRVPVAQPVAVPVVREITIPVEKVVPYPVEKRVPYTVEKHVPYKVEKYIKVPVHRPVPYRVPVFKTVFHKVKSHGWN